VVVAGSPVGKSDLFASFAQESTEAVEDLVVCRYNAMPERGVAGFVVKASGIAIKQV
jgi:hypothetical protein